MTIDTALGLLKTLFAENQSPHQEYSATSAPPYDVKASWKREDESAYIPLGNENGIYFYVARDRTVLYIGKADQEAPGGLGRRCCDHLRRFDPSSGIMFPVHQWADDPDVSDDARGIVASGDFLIVTVQIKPAWMAGFTEKVMLLLCRSQDRKLPVLNKQV